MGQGSETATALLDANGSFHFASVPFGSYVLTAGAVSVGLPFLEGMPERSALRKIGVSNSPRKLPTSAAS